MAEDKRMVTIVVNGNPHEWPKDEDISYAQVVKFVYPDFEQHPEFTYSVKYKNGHGSKPEGVLAPGSSVKVKDGEIFTVSRTGQS
ncbi:MAG: multiubiquitin domain-containing protein [Acidobacteria bacterium]|nr:multiubiquitin domain-containing protein [Acidobacteriota bacterium]